MRWSLVTAVCCAFVARGATFTAASCQRADVESAVVQASAGDEVRIPAGTCTWTTQLTITKPLTLRGAGQGVTIIRDGVVKNGMDGSLLLVFDDASGLRMTALTIEGLEDDPGVWNFGHVAISGETRAFRIDHVTFSNQRTSAIRITGRAVGVVDHCAFSGDFKQGVVVDHGSWDGGSWGDVSWASPSSFGTAENVFVEDCTFVNAAQAAPGGVAALGGARVVVRHNVFVDELIYASGTDSSGRYRSSRHLEVSNNRFQTTKYLEPAVVVNGGTAVVFGNLIDPLYGATVGVEVVRARASFQVWGRCNGSNAWDENAQPSGAACLDGVGRGMGMLVTGDMPTPMWPQQEREPVYAWNNTYDGGATFDDGSPTVLVAGVDYIEGARPGFAEFQYPHPLVISEVMLDDGGIIGVDGGASRRYWQIVSGCSSAPVSIVALLVLLLGRRRERGSRRSSLCALLLVTTLSGCATFKTNAFVNDTTGTAVTLDELRGQVVVVNFWAEWCKACIIELPALAQVAEEKKAVLLPAYFTDKPRNPRFYEWLASQPPWFRERVVWADRSVRMGHDLSALPLTVVLARSDGQVVERFVGTVSKSKLREAIERAEAK